MKKAFVFSIYCLFSLLLLFSEPISTIIIDPGHGGKDPGALGKISQEKNLNLELALNLQDQILKLMPEKKIILTRDSDIFVSLKERSKLTQQFENSIFISLHANSSTFVSASGYEIFYTKKFNNNKILAQTILERINFDFPELRNRGLKNGNLYVLNNSMVPSVLIEIGFISNQEEEKLISSPTFLLELSKTIAKALENYCSLDEELR
ncbi:MAG: N-acetylmuramoyl-L-alanine amidase [Sphaerochaetaceae bacterium]|nr:N-acetylmuramoyl-L-alanine amidase [Sphaerochaetaceae bacterium]